MRMAAILGFLVILSFLTYGLYRAVPKIINAFLPPPKEAPPKNREEILGEVGKERVEWNEPESSGSETE